MSVFFCYFLRSLLNLVMWEWCPEFCGSMKIQLWFMGGPHCVFVSYALLLRCMWKEWSITINPRNETAMTIVFEFSFWRNQEVVVAIFFCCEGMWGSSCWFIWDKNLKMFSMGPMYIPMISSILFRDTRNSFDTASSDQGICICICIFMPCVSKWVSILILLIKKILLCTWRQVRT